MALVTCSLGLIANGASATVTIVATQRLLGHEGEHGDGAATSNGTEYDPNPVNDIATATTTVTGGAAPLCALPGEDGAGGTLSGVVNTLLPRHRERGRRREHVHRRSGAARAGGGPAISANDLLLVIQMQDATINTTNTVDYGDGPTGPTAPARSTVNAGKYEFVRARGAVGDARLRGGQRRRSTGTGADGGPPQRLHERRRDGREGPGSATRSCACRSTRPPRSTA